MEDGTYKLSTVTRYSGFQLGTTPFGESTDLTSDRALTILQDLLSGREIGVWTDDDGNRHVETSEHVEGSHEAHVQAVVTNQQSVWSWSQGRCVTILDSKGRTASDRVSD